MRPRPPDSVRVGGYSWHRRRPVIVRAVIVWTNFLFGRRHHSRVTQALGGFEMRDTGLESWSGMEAFGQSAGRWGLVEMIPPTISDIIVAPFLTRFTG